MRKTILYILVGIVIIGGLFGFLSAKEESPDKKEAVCHELVISIVNKNKVNFLDENNIITMLKNADLYPVNRPLHTVNTYNIEQKLSSNGLILKVKAYKTPSGNVKIEITQKIPILRVFNAKESFYVDESGSIMPADYLHASYLPVASGAIERKLATTDLYKFALYLQKHDFWNHLIEQIYVHPDNEAELIPRVGDYRIILGSFDDFTEKMNNLQLFYEQAIPKLGWDKYKTINLKYKNQIVCTKK
ncbi:MAG: cell division protein FtsQ [Tannerella sp.]|jgi:cell division protein FtsQ|nr:cell division protein FtsQ [Tannerella sp.]